MEDVTYLSARVLAARIRRREVTAVEVLGEYLKRIEECNPWLNAVVSLDEGRALAAARAADAALASGAEVGPLHGVPMTLKDSHDVAGLRTTVGTPVLDRVPDGDGTVAARLRAAGAVIVGHTNVPPFLADYRTENDIFGRTSNPWNLARSPGGSSGGAAAALATGLTPVEVGSDLAGSLRLPPHFCGVYGLKATEHRVPTTGFFGFAGAPNPVRILGALGPMARDLDDLELVLRVISGPDGVDGDVPPVPLRERRPIALAGQRLAMAPMLPGSQVAADLREHVLRVAAGAADAGAVVDHQLPDLDWTEQSIFVPLMESVTTALLPGTEQRPLAWYLRMLHRRDVFAAAWEQFFTRYAALILPPAVSTAFAHDTTDVAAQGGMLVFANLAGLPALVVPAGKDADGLPIGIQIIGPRWSEIRLITIAAALIRSRTIPGRRDHFRLRIVGRVRCRCRLLDLRGVHRLA